MDPAAMRERLLALRAELLAEDAASEESRAPVELDQTSVGRLSRIDSLQMQAMAQAAQQRRRAELGRIERALQRIETDDHGFCAACGEEIAARRLELDPATPTCINCAAGAA